MSDYDKVIFLDMDGVCVDLHAALSRLHGREDLIDNYPKGTDELHIVFGMDEDEMWKPVNAMGSVFWRYLPALPWFVNLHCALQQIAPVVFLTSPGSASQAPDAARGKIEWLRDQFGDDFMHYVLTPNKAVLARPNAVLVDDRDVFVKAYREAGGQAVLFPRQWNLGQGDWRFVVHRVEELFTQ